MIKGTVLYLAVHQETFSLLESRDCLQMKINFF